MKKKILFLASNVKKLLLFLFVIACSTAFSQSKKITGTVKDDKRAALAGVSVSLKGTETSTATDASGRYSISVPDNNGILVFSYVNMSTSEVAVKGKTVVDVSLTRSDISLSDVVVIGYGTARRKDLTGSIVQVKATQLESENPRSVQDILRGNAPGLDVGFDASTKGSGASLLVRGRGSIKANTAPLIVLNGSIYPGSLADINPNDIATIDILKDASAAAVYGSQASNGVIAITTKKGKLGKPVITFNSNIGFNKTTSVPHLLNGNEFIRWRQDAMWAMANFDSSANKKYKFYNPNELPSNITLQQWLALGGNTQQSNAADPIASWLSRLNLNDIEIANYKAGKSINFDEVYYNQRAMQHDHTISISQRKEDYFYYFSLGYLQNQGITNGEKPYSVFRTTLNLESEIAKYLTIGAYLQFSERNENGIVMNRDDVSHSSPWGNLYNPDGTPTNSVNADPAVAFNPIYTQMLTDRVFKYDNALAILSVKGQLPYGFSYDVHYRATLGFEQQYNHFGTTPVVNAIPLASRNNRSSFNWLLDNTLRWNRSFYNHNIGLQFTQTVEKNQSWYTSANAGGFSPNDQLSYHNIQSGTQVPTVSSNDDVTTGAALTGRLSYDFNKRYFLTGTFRRDGYSGFGANFRYANFYSAGFQWAFSDEKFMRGSQGWLDYAKLRISYGQNGNRTIPDPTATLSLLGTGSYSYVNSTGGAYNLAVIFANSLANPSLQWEKKAGVNVGIDFSIFRNIVSGNLDVYSNNTSNLLVQRSLPSVSGFTNIWANLGGMQNQGVELSVNTMNMRKPNFEWSSSISIWLNQSKVTALYGSSPLYDATGRQIGLQEKSDTTNGWFIGKSLAAIYDYKIIGVWQANEAAEAAMYKQFPGDFRILDVNADKKITAQNDKVFQGNSDPKISFNLRNEFKIFTHFDFAFSLYARLGQKTSAGYRYNNDGFANRFNFFSRPYWTPSNPINDHARISSFNASVGSANYIKSSFVRLNNISLSYNVPSTVTKRCGIKALKIYANVVNAAVFSNWSWYDPENQGPTPKTYNLGLNLTL